MKLTIFLAGLVSAQIPTFAPPGPDDVRGPCPGLNTLANHGLLPRSGKNITQADLVTAMRQGVNQDESISVLLFRAAAQTNPSKDNVTFSLPDLGSHNILEHDASLSRQDAFFGDPNPFNQTIFDETLAQWTEDTISVNTSAKGRAARIRTSNATNPEFGLSRLAQAFTTGESVAFIMVFGDVQTGVAPKAPVQFFFEKEQFPPGYAPPANVVTNTNLQDLSQRLGQALVAEGVNISTLARPRRRDVHGGFW
ncbi:uncharacterized protein J7T55_003748 [Diaporthe amygdali]|uniref:uncharacterized protein n=1 Tax=Phomopsis amygdali TaxID=1214568 RepID=UPI0022FDFEDE|nr:uncharacterized protein J7T55_003748 [Diaporthe amygdali]KAJ0117334.1 uncharacterized protein J7T55_003748 [Diaporthe amygdali]